MQVTLRKLYLPVPERGARAALLLYSIVVILEKRAAGAYFSHYPPTVMW